MAVPIVATQRRTCIAAGEASKFVTFPQPVIVDGLTAGRMITPIGGMTTGPGRLRLRYACPIACSR